MIRLKYYVILLFFISCSDNKSPTIKQTSGNEIESFEYWKEDYKIVTFQRCLFLGYNKNEQIRDLLKVDRSHHQDFAFGLSQYKYIDSIVRPIIVSAKIDSTNFFHTRLKGMNEIEKTEMNGTPIIKFCLEYFTSTELDSIAYSRTLQMNHLWKSERSN